MENWSAIEKYVEKKKKKLKNRTNRLGDGIPASSRTEEEQVEEEKEATYSSAWCPGPTRGLPPVGKAAAGWLLSL